MTYCPPRSIIVQNFSLIAQTVFEICVTGVFQSLALIFDPSGSSKVKFDGGNRKPTGPTYKCSGGSNVVSVTVFEIFQVKILTVDLLTLNGLTPRLKVTKRGDDVLATQVYHPAKFQPNRANGLRDMCYQIFSLFGLGGLTPGPKFTKRGDDLLATQLRHSAKFHRPTSTHAGDIRYQKACGHTHTNKKQ